MSRARLGLAALCAVAVAGCDLPQPQGPAPMRFRDALFDRVTVTRDVVYGNALNWDGTRIDLRLDLYEPAGDTAARRPVAIFVHGGGFRTGSKNGGSDFGQYFARRGYLAASIDYRLLNANPACAPDCPGAQRAGQHDAQAAVRWFRANAAARRADPDRIAMAGVSAGAIATMRVATRRHDPGQSGNPGPSSAIGAAVSIAGGLPNADWIDPGDAPSLLMHGTADPVVPYQRSQLAETWLRDGGVHALYQPFAGEGHDIYQGFRAKIHEQSGYWLFYKLRPDLA